MSRGISSLYAVSLLDVLALSDELFFSESVQERTKSTKGIVMGAGKIKG